MADVTQQQVLEALKSIKNPVGEGDVVSGGLISGIFIANGKVFFSVTVPAERAQELEPLRVAAEKAVARLPGVASAVAALTGEK